MSGHVGRSEEHIAKGMVIGRVMKRVVVSFDDETFAEIRRRALRDETSFAEQVRRLVEWGLEVREI